MIWPRLQIAVSVSPTPQIDAMNRISMSRLKSAWRIVKSSPLFGPQNTVLQHYGDFSSPPSSETEEETVLTGSGEGELDLGMTVSFQILYSSAVETASGRNPLQAIGRNCSQLQ
ncbi:unnamed protein product [Linum trigynum]|uniref:Uncharacterized protein n=1 Tax=Linum trigynum TaxID=586398 RepID=A0AAV2DBK9_9ROSI